MFFRENPLMTMTKLTMTFVTGGGEEITHQKQKMSGRVLKIMSTFVVGTVILKLIIY